MVGVKGEESVTEGGSRENTLIRPRRTNPVLRGRSVLRQKKKRIREVEENRLIARGKGPGVEEKKGLHMPCGSLCGCISRGICGQG